MALNSKVKSTRPADHQQSEPTTTRIPTNNNRQSFVETLVSWALKVPAFILGIPTAIFRQFLTPGTDGATFLGRGAFLFLTVLSSDSYWQILYQGKALFPWYESEWTGWGWVPSLSFFPLSLDLGLFVNFAWIACVVVGLAIQSFQSAVFNGEKFLGQSGRMLGVAAIATWVFDLILTFTSRNPMRYDDPSLVLQCVLFNIFTIFCAEIGRWVEIMMVGSSK